MQKNPPGTAAPKRLLPGLGLAAIAAVLSTVLAKVATHFGVGILSPLIIALVLGAVVGSTWHVPKQAQAGTSWTARHVLRGGIVLLGLDLSLGDLIGIGWEGAVVIVVTITTTFLGTQAIGKLMGIAERTRLYVATGFSICGAAAIAAMEGTMSGFDDVDTAADKAQFAEAVTVVATPAANLSDHGGQAPADRTPADVREAQLELRADAREAENSNALGTALALVTVYGSLMILLLPWLSRLLGLTDDQAGLWIGASTHEVAHVVAAAGLVSSAALAVATISKLARVVLLAPLVMIISIVTSRRRRAQSGEVVGEQTKRRSAPIVPMFVLGFLTAIVLRSTGILPDALLTVSSDLSKVLLTAAMFALGTTIDVPVLVRTGRPALALGAISTAIAVGVSLVGVVLLG